MRTSMQRFKKKIFIANVLLAACFAAVLFPLVRQLGRFELASKILFLFFLSLLHMAILRKIFRPIQKIIDCIRQVKDGKEELLPHIEIGAKDEFSTLAYILNSLTNRIQNQIDHLTRQRKETEDILESLNEGIIATDTSAKVIFINQVACHMLGVSREEIVQRTLNTLQTSEFPRKCHELALHALQTSEPLTQGWALREKGTHLTLVSAPLAHRNGALLVLQDKTSDYKVIELGKDFVANASHELRTPITIIRGFAETLHDVPDLSKEMLHAITEKIVRTCGRLDKLVRSLITLADIENLSTGRFKAADLIALAENCKHHILAAYPCARLTIQCSLDSAPILADADLCELAITNLLENAVKYSPAPAQIEIAVYSLNHEFHLSVQDRGIGISASDLPRIFDRFYTVDKARSRKSGGAGLGLSIVKTIIDKHRGRVTAASTLGQGSLFTLIFPNNHHRG